MINDFRFSRKKTNSIINSSIFVFADLKADVFTTEGKSDFISELENTYKCVIEVRTKG